MAPPPLLPDTQTTLETVQTLQQQRSFEAAGTLLAAQVERLLAHHSWQTLADLLANFPADVFSQNPDLHYVEGLVYARAGRLTEAVNLLERAKFSYTVSQQDFDKTAQCALEIVRIYLSREHFAIAYHYLNQEVEPLIQRGAVVEPGMRARFFLRMAEITPDIGKLRASAGYAKEAFTLYQTNNDLVGQFYALVRIASAAVHLGDVSEAASYLELAKTYLALSNLGPMEQTRLLNIEIHLHWHRGELFTALQLTQRYRELVDREEYSNFRVYARMLLGNLLRGLGEFAQAEQSYAAARQVAAQLDYALYYPWIDVQTAWLRTLQNRLDEARALVYASLKTSDLGQAMSFRVFLAVIEMLDGKWGVAERLLRESYTFYEKSGDELTLCALRFHLAQIALQQNETAQAGEYLHDALAWLAQRRLAYFPHWWHPPIVSAVCAHALTLELYPEVVERIFLNHLQQTGVPALRALLQAEKPAAHARAYHLLHMLEGSAFDELTHLPAGKSKQVLAELLEKGLLRRAGFARLQAELTTAQHRHTPNSTLLAVFGLYVNGVARAEIAERLGCSLPTVRNYITAIYQHLGLADETFPNRRARHRRLVEVAREKGFVD